MKLAISVWVAFGAVSALACYGTRESGQGLGADHDASVEEAPPPTAAPPNEGAAGRGAPAGRPAVPAAGRSGGTGGSGCGAIVTPENERIYIDQDAFSGIGGAGATLAGTCKRCGWDSRGDMCQSLVASVPTISNPNYYPCLDLSVEFASCLGVESCVCGGEIPKRCAALKAKQDACLQGGPDAGAADTPVGWMEVETRCHFGFAAPIDYRDTPVQGTDSCVLSFSAGDCQFSADYGAFSGMLTASADDEDVNEVRTSIDGRDAQLVSFTTAGTTYVAGVYFPDVRTDATGVRLSVVAKCQTAAAQSDAHALFRTIDFTE